MNNVAALAEIRPTSAIDIPDTTVAAREAFEIDTDMGHSASGPEWAKWSPTLKEFIAGLDR